MGQKLEVDFPFVNVGDNTLELLEVFPSCGCTTATPSGRKFEPGQKGSIHIVFDTQGRPGENAKPIKVTSNSISNPVVTLMVVANVRQDIRLSPQEILAESAAQGEILLWEIRVYNSSAKRWRFHKIEVSRPEFKIQLAKKDLEPRSEVTFSLEIRVPRPATDNITGRVTFWTDNPDFPRLDLPVVVRVAGKKIPSEALKSRPRSSGK